MNVLPDLSEITNCDIVDSKCNLIYAATESENYIWISLHKFWYFVCILCDAEFSLICAWINGWINNGEAGDLRRHRFHYDDTVKHPWLIRVPVNEKWIALPHQGIFCLYYYWFEHNIYFLLSVAITHIDCSCEVFFFNFNNTRQYFAGFEGVSYCFEYHFALAFEK